jgi:hypothetical protein
MHRRHSEDTLDTSSNEFSMNVLIKSPSDAILSSSSTSFPSKEFSWFYANSTGFFYHEEIQISRLSGPTTFFWLKLRQHFIHRLISYTGTCPNGTYQTSSYPYIQHSLISANQILPALFAFAPSFLADTSPAE